MHSAGPKVICKDPSMVVLPASCRSFLHTCCYTMTELIHAEHSALTLNKAPKPKSSTAEIGIMTSEDILTLFEVLPVLLVV